MDMALKKGTRETRNKAMTFRFTETSSSCLRTLVEYSGMTQVEVIENLIEGEYSRLMRTDEKGLKKAEKFKK